MASDFERTESSSFDRSGGRSMDENDINRRGNEGRRETPSERANPRPSNRPDVPDSSIDPSQRDDDDFEREIETTARPVGTPLSTSASRRSAARNIAASQALVTNPSPSRERSRDREVSPNEGRRRPDGRPEFARARGRRSEPPRDSRARARTFTPPERSRFSDRDFSGRGSAGQGYGERPGVGAGGGGFGGGFGGSGGPTGSPQRSRKLGGVTILIIAILVAFFSGFAMRDFYTAKNGFDDERPIRAEQVPPNLREFCVDYNGLPSFTLVNVASNSALSATTVPILKLDTCTIPTNQTANALQALGIDRRSTSIGLQLGGSNLTLVNLPVTGSLSVQLLAQFPSLADNLEGRDRQEKERALEQQLASMLRSGANGLALQNIIKTNRTDVYAIAPGHTFQLQPNIQAPAPLQ
ncbi:MAG: hypothetical protein AB4050_12115 [Synechococcus sp.]